MSKRRRADRSRNLGTVQPPPSALSAPDFAAAYPLRPTEPWSPRYMGGDGARADVSDSWNISYHPRSEQARLPFCETLEAMARSNDVMQACIAFVQNQIVALDWAVTVEAPERAGDPIVQANTRMVQSFFRAPNRIDGFSWSQWLRPILYEMLVTDATAIQPVFDRLGRIHSFVQLDGKTIKVLLDELGHVPRWPEPAYQQVLKGRVEGEFTRCRPGITASGQLFYYTAWPRKDSPYGHSPVERVMTHILTGIHRWSYGLEYYNETTLPVVYVETPEGTTPDQSRQWHDLLNDVVAMRTGKRFKFLPLPPGANVREVKTPVWTKDQDEWIARVLMFALGVNPLPLVSQMNRATAETAETIQTDAGLQPLKQSLAEMLNALIAIGWGTEVADEIAFVFTTDKTDVSLARAQTLALYQANGWMRAWEVRENILGLAADEGIRDLDLGPLQPATAPGMPFPRALPAGPAVPSEIAPAEVLPNQVLNGAQVQAASQIVQSVADGLIPRDSGLGQLIVLFNLTAIQAEMIMGSAGKAAVATTPNPKPADAGELGARDPDAPIPLSTEAREDLSRWRRICRRAGHRSDKAAGFATTVIPEEIAELVRGGLAVAEDEADVERVFAVARLARPHRLESRPAVKAANRALMRAVADLIADEWQTLSKEALDGVER